MRCFINFQKISLAVITLITFGLQAMSEVQMPTVVIKTIKNCTCYNLIVIDRLQENTAVSILAGEEIETDFLVENNRKFVISGSTSQFMAREAQYVIKRLDETDMIVLENEVYLNIHSNQVKAKDLKGNFIYLTDAKTINFFMAGNKGGLTLSSYKFLNPSSKFAEFKLLLYMQESDINYDLFRLYANYKVIER